jgi:predicted Fe-Mo cluster-binding NifX family protein
MIEWDRPDGPSSEQEAATVIVCVPVTTDGNVDSSWGRAARVAVARLEGGRIVAWNEHDVAWDVLHDVGTEGGHHARVATFLRDHAVEVVVAGHMGPPMVNMLSQMRILARLGAQGRARDAVEAAGRLDA